jgi:hypothetical protein
MRANILYLLGIAQKLTEVFFRISAEQVDHAFSTEKPRFFDGVKLSSAPFGYFVQRAFFLCDGFF